MDFAKLVEELHSECKRTQSRVNDLYRIIPGSFRDELSTFCESVKSEFSLPAVPKKGEIPYLVWSLEVVTKPIPAGISISPFVRMCYDEGEFGFDPYHSFMWIFRRTPAGWGQQANKLADMLVCVEKRMKSGDDIPRVLKHIAQTVSLLPRDMELFLLRKVLGFGPETQFFCAAALDLLKSGWRKQEELDTLAKLRLSSYREMVSIGEGLRTSKQFTENSGLHESADLQALRERCVRLAGQLDPAPYDWMD